MLNGPEELAIVASPPVAHAEQVRALLEHGKHVLCEKPFVLDRAASESLVHLARERGLLCAAGMVRRFSRSACLLRQLLSEERPTRLVWHEGSPFRWPVDSPAYFAPDTGNQLLWDIGSHVVDLLVWWLGVPHELACRDDAMGGSATNCLLELEWPDGCSAEVRLSREYELPRGLVVERAAGVLSCRDVAEGTYSVARRRRPHRTSSSGSRGGRSRRPDIRTIASSSSSITSSPPSAAPRRSGCLPRTCRGGRTLARAEAGSRLLEAPWLSQREVETVRALRAGAGGCIVLRVGVIGANGFIGSRLVEQWHLEERVDVVPIVRRPEAAASVLRFGLDCRVADALDEYGLTRALTGCDAVVHTAPGRAVGHTEPGVSWAAAARAGSGTVIYLSSMAVHGWKPAAGDGRGHASATPSTGPVQPLEGPWRAGFAQRLPRDRDALRDSPARCRPRAAFAVDHRFRAVSSTAAHTWSPAAAASATRSTSTTSPTRSTSRSSGRRPRARRSSSPTWSRQLADALRAGVPGAGCSVGLGHRPRAARPTAHAAERLLGSRTTRPLGASLTAFRKPFSTPPPPGRRRLARVAPGHVAAGPARGLDPANLRLPVPYDEGTAPARVRVAGFVRRSVPKDRRLARRSPAIRWPLGPRGCVMASPLVSAVTIVRDGERFLAEALDSMLGQSYSNLEHRRCRRRVDRPEREIAERFVRAAPDRVQLVRQPDGRTRGMSAARALGVRTAQGELIGFLDADDVWLPEKIGEQVAVLKSYPTRGWSTAAHRCGTAGTRARRAAITSSTSASNPIGSTHPSGSCRNCSRTAPSRPPRAMP